MAKGVIVKKSKIHKKGVFASKDFKKGDIVLKWKPKIISKQSFEKLDSAKKHYTFQFKDKYFLMQYPEKFVNHSCKANTKSENLCDIAIRNIKKGEEITADYGKEASSMKFKCNCRSKKCRGEIK